MRHYQATLKHSFSCLSDMPYEVMVDEIQKEVAISLSHFDSELVADIVTRILPREMGVVAFRDDNVKANGPAPYGLVLRFNGQSFITKVVKLLSLTGHERISVVFAR